MGPEHREHEEKGVSSGAPTGDQGLSSVEQIQLDFVEMLRSRDERRRMRHVETLRRQKEAVDDDDDDDNEEPRVEILGDLEETSTATVSHSGVRSSKPAPLTIKASPRISTSSETSPSTKDTQFENGESSSTDLDPPAAKNPARKFVSSVSISLDKSPSTSGRTTPMSPSSPTTPLSPRENWSASRTTPSPVQNGHTHQNDINGSSKFETTSKPAFVRQSSRTISFRLMKKKEEETSPLQRRASVRIASKKFEQNPEQSTEAGTPSAFQRNSRQRISSRSIQEKMERLAQTAQQRSEMVRSPDISQKTLSMMEEVSRKRGLFEQQQDQSQASPGVGRQDLRHVDITSKKSLFEKKAEESNPRPGKI
ncbi:hypothetical protein NQD34_005432 [Periophthalmus magnuspinnatus]|nr:hypothetical protein NQD34_005432 [Periophthalmus magnuspinnatus]